jgi:RNA-directed DNA polymerase
MIGCCQLLRNASARKLVALQVEVNEEKSRIVDLGRGASFGYLGFDFRRIRSQRGVWCAHYTPKLKKRTAQQPADRVIYLINPVLRGWVNYFAVGNSDDAANEVWRDLGPV